MSWQDLVLTVGQFVFVLALLPSILGPDKPAVSTSLINGTVLVIFALVELTLNLVFTSILVGVTAAGWFLLAFQGIRRARRGD
jgi:hypothetical protein